MESIIEAILKTKRDIYKGCNPDSLDIDTLNKEQKCNIYGSGGQVVFCNILRQQLKALFLNRNFLIADTKQNSGYNTQFDKQYGDFLIVDLFTKEIQYFDLKVTTKQGFRGTIELPSLEYVYHNKWFISLDYNGSFCLINSKEFKEWINNTSLLQELKNKNKNPICKAKKSEDSDFYYSWVIDMYIKNQIKQNKVV